MGASHKEMIYLTIDLNQNSMDRLNSMNREFLVQAMKTNFEFVKSPTFYQHSKLSPIKPIHLSLKTLTLLQKIKLQLFPLIKLVNRCSSICPLR